MSKYNTDLSCETELKKEIDRLIQKQMKKGLEKYGNTLDDYSGSHNDILTHLVEELIDAIFYIQKSKKESFKYPKVKFVDENNLWQQLEHVKTEIVEINLASNVYELWSEVCDLEHSVESLVRTAQRAGMNLERYREKTILKNQKRGYYDGIKKMHCYGSHEVLNKTCQECADLTCREFTRRSE